MLACRTNSWSSLVAPLVTMTRTTIVSCGAVPPGVLFFMTIHHILGERNYTSITHTHTHTYIYIYYIDTTLIATQGAPMQLMQVLRHLIAFSYVVLVRAFLLAYSGPERPIRPRWVEKSFLQTLPFSCAMSAASQLWRPAEFGKSSSQHPNAKERSNQPHHPKAR